jgi:tRNA G10  N-methylase Trm11
MHLAPAGSVDFKTPDTTVYFVENFGSNADPTAAVGPSYTYLGRLVAVGQRRAIKKFSLKTRKLIGNTVGQLSRHLSRCFAVPRSVACRST